ncbi:retrovirus-related pol polyprotein from transposon TNT 1-94 [Tanacetum coccineum]
MENLNEVRVKELRSDNGTEFRNHKLEEFYDEKGISQNFSSPCTPEQNGVAERRNRTLIEAARTMLNSINFPKIFWGEAINTACYTQNRSIIVKRHVKTAYDVFRGRSPDISYFHMFGCPMHIHNHKDHLGKFDEKEKEMEESYHVTFSEDDEAISQASTEGDAVNFNENKSFPNDEFLEPRNKVSHSLCNHVITIANDHPVNNEPSNLELFVNLEPVDVQDSIISESISKAEPSLITTSPSAKVFINPLILQDRWSREKHIEPVNILGEPQAGVSTRSKIRDSKAESAHECIYVNFFSEIEPKKLIEALEEEGWIIAMQEELNQFERNKVWTLVHIPHGKTSIETKWIWKNKIDEHGVVVKNKARLAAQGAFLNGKILEEVYVQQPPRFESSEFPNHVCKLDKAPYSLKQAPKAWYETLSKFLLQYIFVRGPSFNMKAYLDSDYARCNLDRKSTLKGCQILGGKLVCWSAKKQSSMSMSSANAEYVAVAACCAQVL